MDIISGSCSGEIYWFRRGNGTTFEPGKPLADRNGKVIQLGRLPPASLPSIGMARAGSICWSARCKGEIYLIPNEGDAQASRLRQAAAPGSGRQADQDRIGQRRPGRRRLGRRRETRPAHRDGDGSVLWYRNIGTAAEPKLAAAEVLVPPSSLPESATKKPGPDRWGRNTKICVTDFNGDGRLDLLVGDVSGRFKAKPPQSAKERREEEEAIRRLPELMKAWAAVFRSTARPWRPRRARRPRKRRPRHESSTRSRHALADAKTKIAAAQWTIEFYKPQSAAHGYVWLFLRKAPPKEQQKSR